MCKNGAENVATIRVYYPITPRWTTINNGDDEIGISRKKNEQIFFRSDGDHYWIWGLFLEREIIAFNGIMFTETGEPGIPCSICT
jgi:hypothetical protein